MNCREATHSISMQILGFCRGTTWQHNLGRQATHASLPSFLGFVELPSGDEHALGDTNQFWFDFGVLCVLGDSDWKESQF